MNEYDYPYIQKWGKLMNSFEYFVKEEVARAQKDNAPKTAIYKRQDGTWAVAEDVKRADAQHYLGLHEGRDYFDDHGIQRCWICDRDMRTSKGDK